MQASQMDLKAQVMWQLLAKVWHCANRILAYEKNDRAYDSAIEPNVGFIGDLCPRCLGECDEDGKKVHISEKYTHKARWKHRYSWIILVRYFTSAEDRTFMLNCK